MIILAIYGQSSVGKSILATELGKRLGAEVRHCGEVLKEKAARLGIPLQSIPIGLHREVDAETQKLIHNYNKTLVIEGRYLDKVLKDIPRVRFIKLICNETTRKIRYLQSQSRSSVKSITLKQRDSENEHLKNKLYDDSPTTSEDWIILETTFSTPEELAETILGRMGQEVNHD